MRTKKLTALLLALTAIGLVSACTFAQTPAAPLPTIAPSPTATPPTSASPPTATPPPLTVQIILIALEDNGQSGDMVGCGDSAIPVQVAASSTQEPLTAALQALLAVHDAYYGESGLYNTLYQSDLRVDSAAVTGGEAVVHLSGTLLLGGVCDNPRVQAQLEGTALQFPEVDTVAVYINDEPLASILSER